MNTLPPALFLMGPTASGKTQVAVELAQQLPVEIISVDSALVYRDMNIGTAKPEAAVLAHAPHHLIPSARIDPGKRPSRRPAGDPALHRGYRLGVAVRGEVVNQQSHFLASGL